MSVLAELEFGKGHEGFEGILHNMLLSFKQAPT
jgi:hypothetical protein